MVRVLMMLEQLKSVTPPKESKPLMCEEEKKAFDEVVKALDTYLEVHNKCAMQKGMSILDDLKDPYYMMGVTYLNDQIEEIQSRLKACALMANDSKEVRNVVDDICKDNDMSVGDLAYHAVCQRIAHGMARDLFKDLMK